MATIRVHTTQNVTLEYEVGSVGDRIVAALLDYGLYIAWFLLWLVLNQYLKLGTVGWFIAGMPTVFYHLVCEIYFNGQSLGKKARSLRVLRLDGTQAGVGDYILRWLLRPLEILTFWGAPAVLTILLNGRGQRLGDLAAGTTVVSLKRPAGSALAEELLPPPGYQVVFPEVANLTDHDIALLRQLLHNGVKQENHLLLHEAALKVREVTGIKSDLGAVPLLRTVLRDHTQLALDSTLQ